MVERKPRAAGGPELQSPARMLVELLELSLGNTTVARAAIAHALSQAGRDELPASAGELLGFVRVHLVGILTGELGARLTLALLDDLEDKLDPPAANSDVRAKREAQPASSEPPTSMRRRIGKVDFRPHVTPAPAATLCVLVVDHDPVGRPALARALLRAKWSVTVVDSAAELAVAFDDGQDFGVVLVHMAHPHASEIVLEIVARYPYASLVARSRDTSRTQAMLEDMGVARVEVRSSDAPPEELVEAIRRTLGV